MASHTVTIEAEMIFGQYYPKGSDTPIPADALVAATRNPLDGLQSRGNLQVGDIVLDALGKPWIIRTGRDMLFDAEVLMADSADSKYKTMPHELSQLEAPITLLAREGDRVDDLVMYR